MSTNKNNLGFTLIEMLLALAIFAYSASAILNVLGQSAQNLSEIEKITFATWVANNRLVELQTTNPWPLKKNAKGEETMAEKVWYWQQEIKDTQDNNFKSVTIKVFEDQERTKQVTSLTTYISNKISSTARSLQS